MNVRRSVRQESSACPRGQNRESSGSPARSRARDPIPARPDRSDLIWNLSGTEVTRRSRTCAQTARAAHDPVENQKARLVAKVLRALLQQQSFESLGDLREALKVRCAQLKIRGVGPRGYVELVDRAIAMVETNTRVVASAVVSGMAVAVTADGQPFSRADAEDRLEFVRRGTGLTPTVKRMPAVRVEDPRQADRRRALQIVSQAIVDAAQRVAVLEAEVGL